MPRRDRASVGDLRKRWSPRSIDPATWFGWLNVRGTRSRQLLRHFDHTESVHGGLAALAKQAREWDWEVPQLDPPQRAWRYFRMNGKQYPIQPDAFGVLRHDGRDRPFFLECERRASQPSNMTRRLAPYLRYFRSKRPIEDQGAPPLLFVVFEDHLAADHFLRSAGVAQLRSDVRVPLMVSDINTLAKRGPLGTEWRAENQKTAGSMLG